MSQKQKTKKKTTKKFVRRHLKIELVDGVARIIAQTHRGSKFAETGAYWIASDGFRLRSKSYPSVGGDDQLFVRGSDRKQDRRAVGSVTAEYWYRLRQAVIEYNRVDGGRVTQKPPTQLPEHDIAE